MILYIIFSLPFLLVFLLYLQHRQEEQRVLSLKALARRRGWRSLPGVYVEVPRRAGVEPFYKGRNQAFRIYLHGTWDRFPFTVSELTCVTGYFDFRRTWEYTVVHVQSPGLAADLVLRPERLSDRIGGLFGHRDIDFASDRRFSRRYLLRGSDETAIRAMFTPELRACLSENPGWCVQVQGPDLFYWRPGRLKRAQELDAVVERAVYLTDQLCAAGLASPRAPV